MSVNTFYIFNHYIEIIKLGQPSGFWGTDYILKVATAWSS